MRSSSSRSREATAVLVAALAGVSASLPLEAWAQACCASAGAVGLGRLAPPEDALVGFGVRGTYLYGSSDRDGNFVGAPDGTVELDLEQDFVATIRVLEHGQLTAVVPIVETYRQLPGASEIGGGLGDAQVAARYDFVEPGRSATWPGIAFSLSAALPTGRAPESAENPLATDATGTGTLQLGAQLAIEKAYRNTFGILTGAALWRSPRVVGEIHEHRGPAFTALLAVGHSFDPSFSGAVTASYTAELDARFEGATVPGSGHELTRLGLSGGYTFSFDWRLQGSAYVDLPVAPLSRNQALGAGLTLVLIRAGW